MKRAIGFKLFGCIIFLLAASCGGGSDEINFSGTVEQETSALRSARTPAVGLQVCALGQCSATDGAGNWAFSVGDDTFEGGSVEFLVQSSEFASSVRVEGLDSSSDEIFINFLLGLNRELNVISVSEVDTDSFVDELDEFGEEIEDENDSASDSIEEEADSAGDSIDEELDSAGDSIDEELDSAGDSIDEELEEEV